MSKKRIITVVGTRPNFVKAAPLHRAFQKQEKVEHFICHTGQHFDKEMSSVFFDELGLPKPDFHLGVRGGSQAEQLSKMMTEFEKVVEKSKPDLVIVVGDVNSTLATAIIASRYGVPLAHVEAGLRSHDRSMPEEINRILTDHLSDYHFTTEKIARKNLEKEGIDDKNIHFSGNVMIDSLVNLLPEIKTSAIHDRLNLEGEKYILTTFHRPANVDNKEFLEEMFTAFQSLSQKAKIIFPLHPRTRQALLKFKLYDKFREICSLTEPAGYIDFLALSNKALMVITDSGGIQEETTYLGVPCITVRDNTERPVTTTIGTNFLAGRNFKKVLSYANEVINGNPKNGGIPELWDGKAAERIAKILINKV